jgi:hypothetical protein
MIGMTRHRLDVFALCSGLLFVGLAIGFLLDGLDVWNADPTWIAPLFLIVLGIAGVLSTLGREGRERVSQGEPAPAPEAETAD